MRALNKWDRSKSRATHDKEVRGWAAVSECVLITLCYTSEITIKRSLFLPSPLSQLTALQAKLNALHTKYLELKMSTDEDLLSLQQQVKAMQKVRWN